MQDEGDDIIAQDWSMLAALESRCPNTCLGRSDAPRCSIRSKCQVKALLHGRNRQRKDNGDLHDMQGNGQKARD